MENRFKQDNYVTICSEKTLQSNDGGFFMQFAENVAQKAGMPWIKNTFGNLKNDRERIRTIYNDPKVKDNVIETLAHVQEIFRSKNATFSQAKRLEAEKLFNNGDSFKALLISSQSVLRAPKTGKHMDVDNGMTLAMALWTRSKILMQLKKYNLALSDVQFALKENLNEIHKFDAFWRMSICYKGIGDLKRAKVSMNIAEKLVDGDIARINVLRKSMDEPIMENKDVSRKSIPIILNTHSKFKNATKKIGVKESKDSGRYIVANENISTGETLVCEPPYASCLLPECFGTHCHHCFERLQAPIGCPDCSSVAFCKFECKEAAISTYHKYECKFLDLLIGSGMSILSHTALRMVTQKSPEEMYEIYKKKNSLPIYSLCTLWQKRRPEDFLQRTLMAAFLLRCLQKSGYFGYIDDNVTPNENQLNIGELLLFHLQMLQFNAHEIYETKYKKQHRFRTAAANYIGVAIYPTVSLFNHDCHSGITRHFVGKNIVITAARPFAPGDLIPENYGPVFTRKHLESRQKSLIGRYWFQCKCLACTQNWPSIGRGLESVSKRIKCPTLDCKNMFTLPLCRKEVVCPCCKLNVNLENNERLYAQCEEQFLLGFNYMDKVLVDSGIQVLSSAIDLFYRISGPPHKELSLAQECLRALLADSGNIHEVPVINSILN